MILNEYLANKPLYYEQIDYTRMPRAYESIKKDIRLPKIIQVIGTNGKGSTGRFLANMLLQKGLSIGHYTSPHIFRFNERIWLNGKDVDDDILEKMHEKLQNLLSSKFLNTLSYFEYTTFLAILIFSQNCDFIVLEAGLGGEFDATTVFPKVLSVVTPIGYDHSSFLGNTIEEIATTKLNSITQAALLSPQYEEIVYKVAKNIAKKKSCKLYLTQDMITDKDKSEIKRAIKEKNLSLFQEINLQTALSASKILGFDIDLQKVDLSTLAGRCQKVAKNITVDVGHNEMAARTIVKCFKDRKVVLVYNSFADKDYKKILETLFPIIKRVEVLHIENPRKTSQKEIKDLCKEMKIETRDFKNIDDDEEYLVFGSFVVVEEFMKVYEGEIN